MRGSLRETYFMIWKMKHKASSYLHDDMRGQPPSCCFDHVEALGRGGDGGVDDDRGARFENAHPL